MALSEMNYVEGGGSASFKIYGATLVKTSTPTTLTLPTSCDFLLVANVPNAYSETQVYSYNSSQIENSVAYKGDTITFTDGGSAVGTYTLSADGNTATVSRTNQNTHLHIAYGKFE